MHGLVVKHLSRRKPVAVPLDPNLSWEGAKISAKHYAEYLAVQLKALGREPEVWSREPQDQTLQFEVFVDNSMIVSIELCRMESYPGSLIRSTLNEHNRVKIHERA